METFLLFIIIIIFFSQDFKTRLEHQISLTGKYTVENTWLRLFVDLTVTKMLYYYLF